MLIKSPHTYNSVREKIGAIFLECRNVAVCIGMAFMSVAWSLFTCSKAAIL